MPDDQLKKPKKPEFQKFRVTNSPTVNAAVDAFREQPQNITVDPLGSYTGAPKAGIKPEQDGDDI